MKKIWMAAALAALCLCGPAAHADMTMDFGKTEETYSLSAPGKPGITVKGALMVPLRQTAEYLGFSVTPGADGIVLDDGVLRTKVRVGTDSYVVSAESTDMKVESAPFSLGLAPVIQDGVTYVPVSLFKVLLGNDPAAVSADGNEIVFLPASEAAPALETQPMPEPTIGMPNPFKEFVTLSGMQESAGFPLALPKVKKAEAVYRAIPGELAEVIYRKGDTELMRIRKGKAADVAGDYNTYDVTKVAKLRGKEVTMKGDKKRMHLAIWREDGFSYAILSGEGLPNGKMKDYAKEVK